MKDLKENIQKNNIKKLVLSVALEEEEQQPEIKYIYDVLNIMIDGQIKIFNAKGKLKDYDKKIYSAIKGEEEKIKKKTYYFLLEVNFPQTSKKKKTLMMI